MARLPDPAVRRRWEERMRLFEESGLSGTRVEAGMKLLQDSDRASTHSWH